MTSQTLPWHVRAGRVGRRPVAPGPSRQPLLNLGDRRAGEDERVGDQHVGGIEVGREDGLDARQVARRLLQHQVVLGDDEERARPRAELVEEVGDEVGLRRVERDLLDDAHRAFLRLHRQRDAQGHPALLARHLLLVAMRVGTEDHAAVAGATGALLLPRLLASTRDVAAGLGLGCSLAVIRLLALDGLVKHGGVERGVEDALREIQVAALLAVLVVDRRRHFLGRHYAFFPLGWRVESRTRTTLFLWPGTSPLTSSRLRSRSTRTTLRCLVVRCWLPRWPAIRIPL